MCHHYAVLEGVHSTAACLPELWNVCFLKFKQPQAPVVTIERPGREYMWDLLEQTEIKKECCTTYSEEVDAVSGVSVVMQSVWICVLMILFFTENIVYINVSDAADVLQTCVAKRLQCLPMNQPADVWLWCIDYSIPSTGCGELCHWECCWHTLSMPLGM